MLEIDAGYLSDKMWIAFLERQPRYSCFCTPGFYRNWIETYSPGARVFGVHIRSSSGEALVPFVEELWSRRLGVTQLSAAPEWGYGLCGNVPGLTMETLRRLLKRHAGRRVLSGRVVTDPSYDILGMQATAQKVAGIDVQETYALRLKFTYDEWFERTIDKRLRRQIRKSQNVGVRTVRHGVEAVDSFYELYGKAFAKDSERANAVRYSKSFLKALCLASGPGSVRIYLSYFEDKPIAGGYLLYGKDDAMAWIGCMDRDFAFANPTENRHARVIADLMEEGVGWYNLGACDGLPGVCAFKRKMGANPVPYQIVTWKNQPLATLGRIAEKLRR